MVEQTVQGRTVVDALLLNAVERPDAIAMRWRNNGRWDTMTWSAYARAVREIVAGLRAVGIGAGEGVAVLANNRPEWHLADLGTMANGGMTVPVYQTSSPDQIAYIVGHSEARLLFLDTHEQLGKVLQIRDRVPKLDKVVIFDNSRRLDDTFVMSFDELRSLGSQQLEHRADDIEGIMAAVQPSQVATLVYTSGTTGPPKGAMLTHGNLIWTLRHATMPFDFGPGERLLSFLPLSHIAERMMSDFLPIVVAGETWFARSLATVAEDLPACRPTVFFAVPRVWEKLNEGVHDALASQPRPLRQLAEDYIALGRRRVQAQQEGREPGLVLDAAYAGLDRFVGNKIRKQMGLDRVHILISAAAPCHPDLITWFHAIGLPITELYGQTEDCGPTTVNRPEKNRIGTVGPPIPGVEVRIADDGEILVKGGNVCIGYYKEPEHTADLLDADGWMHTGDVGAFDDDGYLRITGRKKDLIITAAGKNIAPQEIEVDLRYHPLISQAVVVGEGRRYLTALITLDPELLSTWAQGHGKLGESEALASDPDVVAHVQQAVDDVNQRRSRAEWIRRFRILAHDLTVAGGELTPTLKVKRNVVYEKYAGLIEDMYAEVLEAQ
jgi:long-chain acyl-CoA synthetase